MRRIMINTRLLWKQLIVIGSILSLISHGIWFEHDITSIMKMLLAAGADVNVVNDDGKDGIRHCKRNRMHKKNTIAIKTT